MQSIPTNERIQKLDEAKEIVVELEEKKEYRLSRQRNKLWNAGAAVDSDKVFLSCLEGAMAETAGLAIEGGYDGLASAAADLVADLHGNQSNNE